ncbi:MAG: MinD/ParA family protein [Candidatus Sumerlaeia bacterium]
MAKEKLRSRSGKGAPTHVITVSSGKGGVGKSNLVMNAGISLAQLGKKVLIMDADMGLANIDILIGLTARVNLSHVLTGEKSLSEIISKGPEGVSILPAASGVEWMTNLSPDQKMDFLQKMDTLNGLYDILLIDTGAGINSNVMYFNLAAQTRIVMVTPEPTSLTDAYALIKVLYRDYQQKNYEIVVNNVASRQEGLEVYRNLTAVADRFLDVRLGYLGEIRFDRKIGQAVQKQNPVTVSWPNTEASQDYRAIAQNITRLKADVMDSQLGLFWRKIFEPASA